MDKKDLLNKANYYYITDNESNISLIDQVQIAVENGVKVIQYREKTKNDREKYEDLLSIKDICEREALVIVNDRVDLALAAEADGVHLGQNDLPPDRVKRFAENLLIGVSTHGLEQAKKSEKEADYMAVGPIFRTKTKEDTCPELGIESAKRIAESVEIPTAAIGGIDEDDLGSLAEAFDMICAISSVTREGELSERISYFEEKIDEVKRR
ncbi:MAG: thiamine phosphate synthase [Candidatus Thermoplasmatota archaeon]|nr:thiamine phosphate synthase [Candidatus Thermoplasmatota archaeon]MBS3789687.1 thiamine phosphate synthase [Candidatus Thermoplasmatota archaeon]